MMTLQMAARLLRRFKWWLIAVFYCYVVGTFQYRILLLLLPLLLLAALAYNQDKQREDQGRDDFRGGWLFYRYGGDGDRTVLSIPVKAEWEVGAVSSFTQSLQADLARRVAARLPAGLVQVTASLPVCDQASGERKDFLRLLVRSRFGSLLTHFIHYASYGRTITAHYFTFVRGTYTDWDVLKFVLESPFTIWGWGIPWLLNRHSIVAAISEFRESSFDAIDIQTMYTLTHQVIYDESRNVLHEAGLLTEEMSQILQMNFFSKMKIGGQKVKINNSPGALIQGVSQSLPALGQPA